MKKNNQNLAGFIAFSTVLVVSVVVLAITTTIVLLSVSNAQSSLSSVNGASALNFVDGCANDGLLKARNDQNYNGGNVTRPEGTCNIGISKNGTTWTMIVSPVNQLYQKNLQVIFTRSATQLSIVSWKEQ